MCKDLIMTGFTMKMVQLPKCRKEVLNELRNKKKILFNSPIYKEAKGEIKDITNKQITKSL